MDEKTLAALKGSIKKWEDIVAGVGADNGPDNCPLCLEFHEDYREDGDKDKCCVGCPVMKRTGFDSCQESPYQIWLKLSDEDWEGDGFRPRTAAQKGAAIDELNFLKSLLPSGE